MPMSFAIIHWAVYLVSAAVVAGTRLRSVTEETSLTGTTFPTIAHPSISPTLVPPMRPTSSSTGAIDDDFVVNHDKIDVYDNLNNIDTDLGDEEPQQTRNATLKAADDENLELCQRLNATHCASMAYTNGDGMCAYNANRNECYTIERKTAAHDAFDDGYYAAHQLHQKDASQVQMLIATLGGVIGLLCALIVIGAYWRCKQAELMQKTNEIYMAHMHSAVQTHIDDRRTEQEADPEIDDEQEKLN